MQCAAIYVCFGLAYKILALAFISPSHLQYPSPPALQNGVFWLLIHVVLAPLLHGVQFCEWLARGILVSASLTNSSSPRLRPPLLARRVLPPATADSYAEENQSPKKHFLPKQQVFGTTTLNYNNLATAIALNATGLAHWNRRRFEPLDRVIMVLPYRAN
ncbi:hypothetical protein ASPZODRAFT_15539 [Penicilliopsis zonata CBS 506.65]|uniref:Uncharacterized protein n=1 Tax=Penicilliopsis zonata CBS 506.65 TaxID=1073090 RepID=A0A1L9SI13_9EURO|nr:hypothetical protein ASPZODRAFT_15539 [Penicilliopsis zonata CBS 506.65]OJJ46845.1 hypothetical protein ASPZODRAFT_15539 [Penicilliopsis zonata CBS 506.65]